jgi:hypothetical protein
METKLRPAKTPLPKFLSENEAADYFQTHSVAVVWNQLPEAEPVKPSKALEKSIRERHTAAKFRISIGIGCRTDCRGQKDRGGQISQLLNAVEDVDSRGHSARGEAGIAFDVFTGRASRQTSRVTCRPDLISLMTRLPRMNFLCVCIAVPLPVLAWLAEHRLVLDQITEIERADPARLGGERGP